MDKVNILNISILSITLNDLLKSLKEGVLITPNVDHLVKLQKDREFYDIYKQAEWIVCDSQIVNLALRFLNRNIAEVIPGSSFFPAFCEYHKNNEEIRIFLLGADKGVANQAMENINSKIGRNIVVGAYSPSYGFEKNDEESRQIVNAVNMTDANVLVVGLGAPKQEKWIMQHKDLLKSIKILMALGATIDFEAGKIKRAPIIYRKIYLEWYFRLIREPRRLWRRYLLEDMIFFWYVIKEKLGLYKNPFLK